MFLNFISGDLSLDRHLRYESYSSQKKDEPPLQRFALKIFDKKKDLIFIKFSD